MPGRMRSVLKGSLASMSVFKSLMLGAAALAAVLAVTPAPSDAAEFPTRPITLIIPFPPGGGSDLQMRILAELASKNLGQPITIENRGGASGTLGPAQMAATAKPDGYTLSQVPATVFRLPYMQKTSFDPKKDFTYITQVAGYLFAVAVKADAPWKTWKELLAYAKANPGKITYSTSGSGGTQHITMEQIAKQQGIKWVQVPFKGGGEQNAALLGGHTDLNAASSGTLNALAEAGTIRLLVVWSQERSKKYPDVPTLVEEGHNLVSTSPYGIAGPKGMDPKVVETLHQAFKKAMDEPRHREVMERIDFDDAYLGPADYTKFVMDFIAEQQGIIEELGLAKK